MKEDTAGSFTTTARHELKLQEQGVEPATTLRGVPVYPWTGQRQR